MMIVPADRTRYLADIAASVRGYHAKTRAQVKLIREIQHLREAAHMLQTEDEAVVRLKALADERRSKLDPSCVSLLQSWPALAQSYQGREQVTKVRDREIRTALTTTSLSGTVIPKVALPRYEDDGEMLSFLRREHLPGFFPYTAGVFPFKREGEDPTRMFAGEGDPFRTNRRFKLISEGMKAKRLSTAFDSVTLYGQDPDVRPDIYGKVGNSGVSIATLDDMKVLYSGFDLLDPSTSVSMTINGPAPTILAMFMNTAIDQQIEAFKAKTGQSPVCAKP